MIASEPHFLRMGGHGGPPLQSFVNVYSVVRMWARWWGLRLPPEMRVTILPGRLAERAHATGQAPAPSAMMWLCCARWRTAAATPLRSATRAPSTSERARENICGKTLFDQIPSPNEG